MEAIIPPADGGSIKLCQMAEARRMAEVRQSVLETGSFQVAELQPEQ